MSGPASMIGSLCGEVLEVSDDRDELLLEVGGVGYRVVVTPDTVRALDVDAAHLDDAHLDAAYLNGVARDPDTLVRVHIHHVVREDSQILYGFATSDERRVFATLIAAHGVGPALALAILSTLTPDELRVAVASGDLDALCAVPGVGRKTAARLLVDLASRLGEPVVVARPTGTAAADRPVDVRGEVRDALLGLGYDFEEIRVALADVPTHGDTSELLRDALRRLATV